MLPPSWLAWPLISAKAVEDRGSEVARPARAADFIARGELDRHLRRMRLRYAQRRRAPARGAGASTCRPPGVRATAPPGLFELLELPAGRRRGGAARRRGAARASASRACPAPLRRRRPRGPSRRLRQPPGAGDRPGRAEARGGGRRGRRPVLRNRALSRSAQCAPGAAPPGLSACRQAGCGPAVRRPTDVLSGPPPGSRRVGTTDVRRPRPGLRSWAAPSANARRVLRSGASGRCDVRPPPASTPTVRTVLPRRRRNDVSSRRRPATARRGHPPGRRGAQRARLPGVHAPARRVHRRADRLRPRQVLQRHGRLAAVPGTVDQRHPARQRRRTRCTSSASSRSPPASPSRSSRATARSSSPPGWPASSSTCSRYSGYYDVALRDFGLMLGALTLARLAWAYDPPG